MGASYHYSLSQLTDAESSMPTCKIDNDIKSF